MTLQDYLELGEQAGALRSIEPSRYTRSIKARRLRGAAALMEALELIGANNATDHDMARVIADNELELRELLTGALVMLTSASSDDH